MRIFLLTALTIMAFAANSILGRTALEDGAIDASSYSLIRLGSGAIMLAILVIVSKGFSRKTYLAAIYFLRFHCLSMQRHFRFHILILKRVSVR